MTVRIRPYSKAWRERTPRDWTERAWIAIARETTDSGRVWRGPRSIQEGSEFVTPLDLIMYLGRRVARTRPPQPSIDEVVGAAVARRYPT